MPSRVPPEVQKFPLNKNSLVFVIGGYAGKHPEFYANLYDPHIYIFEPQEKFAKYLKDKFSNNKKVKVFAFGLADSNFKTKFGQAGTDGCSYIPFEIEGVDPTFKPYIKGRLKDIASFMEQCHIKEVDLCLMNCEGSEFVLLPYMIDRGIISKFKYLMVQFHIGRKGYKNFFDIVGDMEITHRIRDDYHPEWVVWERR